VGKTTSACCTALHCAEEFKTLLVSTDPAHSLSDSLEREIGDEIKPVRGVPNLSALEVNAEKTLAKFKIAHEDQIKAILETSTYLDQEDIEDFFALPIPGMDEVLGLKTIVDVMEERSFEKVIVDTAPTGHALRLLTLPGFLDDWIKVLAKMRWKYRYLVQTFSGQYHPDSSDDFLVTMKKTVKRIEGLLRDGLRSEFIAVVIPESMAILETRRLVHTLDTYGIKVQQMVVNNVVESRDCSFCQERAKAEEDYITHIHNTFNHLTLTLVPLQPREVKGIEDLNRLKKHLFL
jgi:arsenite-transporting ATPase